MAIVTPKRIKHLSRYFAGLGLVAFAGYWYTDYSYNFLLLVGPCFYIVYFLRHYGSVVLNLLPNEPTFNKIFLLFPVTVFYFGLVGYHLKNILNEQGKIRLLIVLAFLGFLGYIHHYAFRELSFYWKGSQKSMSLTLAKSAHSGSGLNLPLGNDQSPGAVVGSR